MNGRVVVVCDGEFPSPPGAWEQIPASTLVRQPLPLCLLGKSDTTHLPKQIQTLDQEKEEQSYKPFHEMAVRGAKAK